MVANLYIAGVSPFAAAASIALLNARHLLYSTALSKHLTGAPKGRLFAFGLEITDETFGVNFSRFSGKDWSLSRAQVVNTASHACWILCTVAGYHAGNLVALPLPVIAFSMTSMFICLLFMQKHGKATIRAALFAALGVVACKLLGFSKAAVLVGSLLGIVAGNIGANGAEACDEVA
jgi:predicted branched-subunit amino acid permease